MLIWTDEEKVSDKIQLPFTMKPWRNKEQKNKVKDIHNKPKWRQTVTIPYKVREKKRVPTLSTLIQHSLNS
jgi:hypothetical protein